MKYDCLLSQAEKVIIDVFEIQGKSMEALMNKRMAAGQHLVYFNNENLPSVLYYYRILAGENQEVNKMIMLR